MPTGDHGQNTRTTRRRWYTPIVELLMSFPPTRWLLERLGASIRENS